MKLLIAGQTGQLARSLLDARCPIGWQVLALGRPQFDLTDGEAVARIFAEVQPDLVVNAAAYTGVDKAEEEQEAAFAVNRDGPALLATQCAQHDISLIHVSTDYVFDGSKASPYIEGDPTAPLGVYGRSKLEGEEAVQSATPKHIILRTAWVHSPFGNNFVKTMLRLANTHDELGVVDDQIGCPSYAPHLAEGILKIAAALGNGNRSDKKTAWGIYHMTGGGETSWCGFAREIFAQSKELGGPFVKVKPIATIDYPTPAQRPKNSRFDCAKLFHHFAIKVPDWKIGVAQSVKRILMEEQK